MRLPPHGLAAAMLMVGCWAGGVRPLQAGPLAVTPTLVALSDRKQSDLLSVTNQSESDSRYQVEAFGWQQGANGDIMLTPTQDIVAFPSLIMLKAGETKRIRVAVMTPSSNIETSYRLTIQELRSAPNADQTGVQVLTKLSLPVFLRSRINLVDDAIEAGPVQGGLMKLSIRNAGTAHFILNTISVAGLDRSGGRFFDISATGWYVLANSVREYQIAIAAPDCIKAARLVLTAQIDGVPRTKFVDLQSPSCGDALSKTRFLAAAGGD